MKLLVVEIKPERLRTHDPAQSTRLNQKPSETSDRIDLSLNSHLGSDFGDFAPFCCIHWHNSTMGVSKRAQGMVFHLTLLASSFLSNFLITLSHRKVINIILSFLV